MLDNIGLVIENAPGISVYSLLSGTRETLPKKVSNRLTVCPSPLFLPLWSVVLLSIILWSFLYMLRLS